MAMVWVGAPLSASADVDFGKLVVVEDISPEERAAKKMDLTRNALAKAVEKTQNMRTALEELNFEEGTAEWTLKNSHLGEVEGYAAFYKEKGLALDGLSTVEEIDALIQEIIDYRENTYAPSAKNVLEFILVFSYSPSVLETARERLGSIQADIERLGGLELIESDQFTETLNQAAAALNEAENLQTQAQLILTKTYRITSTEEIAPPVIEGDASSEMPTTADPLPELIEAATGTEIMEEGVVSELASSDLTARELAEESLNKIKGLYNIFMETGQKVKETLGI